MKNKSIFFSPGLIALVSLLVLWGCAKKAEINTMQETPQEAAAPVPTIVPPQEPAPIKEEPKEAPASKEASAQQEAPVREVKEEPREQVEPAGPGLQPIYFDFDRAFIRDDAKSVMKANADWLKAHPKVKVRIEGNCDERGTKEYNQALGQRRAMSAKKYLTDLGISSKRLSLISYGKEKPVCAESTEECWQKNRRDDLVAVTE